MAAASRPPSVYNAGNRCGWSLADQNGSYSNLSVTHVKLLSNAIPYVNQIWMSNRVALGI